MGLFDVFKGSGGGLQKHINRVTSKRAQSHERWESIQALANDGSDEAIRALLSRFSVRLDPSITDREEKDEVFQCVVRQGEAALGPVRDFLAASDTLAWPLKMLKALQSEEEVTTTLLELLSGMDTEYERDPQKKIDALASLEERKDPRIVEAVTRFLEDTNETVRFHAVGAIRSQEDAEAAKAALAKAFAEEESVRIRMMILDAFIERQWMFDAVDEVKGRLPVGYSLGKRGDPRKNA